MPVLRNRGSKSESENEIRTRSSDKSGTNSRPQRNRKNLKENKENVTTRRNVRKNVVQPLQEQNSIDEKNAKVQKSNSFEFAVEASNCESISTNHSKKRIRKESATENIVTETEPSKADQPKSSTKAAATKKPVVWTITTRNKKQSKDIRPLDSSVEDTQRQDSREPAQEMLPIDKASRRTRPDSVERTETRAKKPVVELSVKTRSGMKRTKQLDQQKSSANTSPTDKPAVVSTHKTRSATKVKGPLTVRADGNQFVTTRKTRRNLDSVKPKSDDQPKAANDDKSKTKEPVISYDKPKAANDDKSKTKEPVISYVTTRRRGAMNIANDLNEVKTAGDIQRSARSQSLNRVINDKRMETNSNLKGAAVDSVDIQRRKRSQSVNRTTNERQMKTNSMVKSVDAVASPVNKQRGAKKAHQTTNGKVTKQPELFVNRSTASDSSDHSNGSVLPIYKRNSNSNNNTVTSVFDFESNSQENTLNTDEQMQEVVAKLVRENKASVVKRKAKAKKGATKPKTFFTRSKKIEKIRADLNELKQLKIRNTKVNGSNVQATKVMPNIQTNTSQVESSSKHKPHTTIAVDGVNVSTKESSSKSHQNDELPFDQHHSVLGDDVDDVDDVMDDVGHVENSAYAQKPSNPLELASTSAKTPPRLFQTTYAGPKVKGLHQSTPVRIVNLGNSSPWRCNIEEEKYSENVFSRYSELDKLPIKSSDISKFAAAAKSPIKKSRPPSTMKPISSNLPEIEKPKTLANDLRNGFGFFDDDDADDNSDDERYSLRPSLPPVENSFDLHSTQNPAGKIPSPKKSTVNSTQNPSGKIPSPKKSTVNSIQKPARKIPSPKKSTAAVKKPATKVLFEEMSTNFVTSTPKNIQPDFRMPQALHALKEKVKLLKNSQQPSVSSDVPRTQSKISTHFGDSRMAQPSTSKGNTVTINKNKVETTRTKEVSETETATPYNELENFSLFDTTWLNREDKPHRSYSRVTKRDHKRQYDHNPNPILTDDESEIGDTVVRKRTKRTKSKDEKLQEELRQFEEKFNSEFMEVENFELQMEKSA